MEQLERGTWSGNRVIGIRVVHSNSYLSGVSTARYPAAFITPFPSFELRVLCMTRASAATGAIQSLCPRQ